jgi:hypothetical protein
MHCSSASETQRTFVTLHLSLFNIIKIAQFGEGIEKIWGVWCKGVECSMMNE